MSMMRPILVLPVLLLASATAALADVRDKAKMFGTDVVSQANTQVGKLEKTFNIPITIETTPSLDGVPIDKAIPEYARRENVRGLYILIARREGLIQAEASSEYRKYFTRPRFQAIYEPFIPGFKKKEYDAALVTGVTELFNTLQAVKTEFGAITPVDPRSNPAPAARRPAAAPAPQARGGFPMMGLIGIVVLILGVVFVVKILGALMGAGRNRGYGGPGYGPGGGQGPMQGQGGYGGGGPGYGGGGYGGQPARGGGFMSSMFGGIGGAMAGNWLYDRFGRSHQEGASGYAPGSESAPADAGPDWAGPNDGGGSWGGDAGGGAAGGGGGDWGGGGGGGGGDWGGSDGGSWGGGGGGGDGGSW